MIGLDLDDGSLYPEQQGHFRALVDFPQNRLQFPRFRAVQLEAIRLAGVDHVALEGRYTTEEIRAIYRKSAIYFLASPESFGLPICELQACGSLVFAPDPNWPASHWLGDDYYAKREPRLSPNFVVYKNDPEILAELISETAATFDPTRVRQTFLEYQPRFFRGDREELQSFLSRVESGEIHSRLHEEHRDIGRNVNGSPHTTSVST
jgi:glycosyltransferase involved in cell wall biosynthesis